MDVNELARVCRWNEKFNSAALHAGTHNHQCCFYRSCHQSWQHILKSSTPPDGFGNTERDRRYRARPCLCMTVKGRQAKRRWITSCWHSCPTPLLHSQQSWQPVQCPASLPGSPSHSPLVWQRLGGCHCLLATLALRTQFINDGGGLGINANWAHLVWWINYSSEKGQERGIKVSLNITVFPWPLERLRLASSQKQSFRHYGRIGPRSQMKLQPSLITTVYVKVKQRKEIYIYILVVDVGRLTFNIYVKHPECQCTPSCVIPYIFNMHNIMEISKTMSLPSSYILKARGS